MMFKLSLLSLNFFITISLLAQNQLISPFSGDVLPNQAATSFLQQKSETVSVNYINLDLNIINSSSNLQLTFDDKNYTVKNDSIASRGYKNYSWFGTNIDNDGYIVVSVLGDDVQGTLRKGNEIYQILTTTTNLRKVVVKIDQSKYPLEYCIFSNTNKQEPTQSTIINNTDYLKTALDTGCPIRSLIMYTPAAEADLVGGGAMATDIVNTIQQAVEITNLSFQRSEITNYNAVEIVLIQKWNYTENTDISVDKNNFRDDNYVNTLRTIFDADYCTLIGQDSDFYGWCGVADDKEAGYTEAFCVVANNCITTNLSFAHELGHLLGANHNEANDNSPPYPYGHGYIYAEENWRTIMSYNASPCGSFPDHCVRIEYWSNPNVLHPMDSVPMGTVSLENNARVLRDYNNNFAQLEQPTSSLILTNSNYATNNNILCNVEVKQSISTSGLITINNGAQISLKAGERVTLNNGFKCRPNSKVHISNQQFEDCP